MAVAEDNHVVETLAADRADQALDEGVLPGASAAHSRLPRCPCLRAGRGRWRRRSGRGRASGTSVRWLRGTPRRSLGRSRPRSGSASVRQDDEDVEHAKGRGRDREKVNGGDGTTHARARPRRADRSSREEGEGGNAEGRPIVGGGRDSPGLARHELEAPTWLRQAWRSGARAPADLAVPVTPGEPMKRQGSRLDRVLANGRFGPKRGQHLPCPPVLRRGSTAGRGGGAGGAASGPCTLACTTDRTCCGSSCVNTDNDPFNLRRLRTPVRRRHRMYRRPTSRSRLRTDNGVLRPWVSVLWYRLPSPGRHLLRGRRPGEQYLSDLFSSHHRSNRVPGRLRTTLQERSQHQEGHRPGRRRRDLGARARLPISTWTYNRTGRYPPSWADGAGFLRKLRAGRQRSLLLVRRGGSDVPQSAGTAGAVLDETRE
jgi:hypothetical protein